MQQRFHIKFTVAVRIQHTLLTVPKTWKNYFTLGISKQVDIDFTTTWFAAAKRAPMKQRKLLSATLRRFHFV